MHFLALHSVFDPEGKPYQPITQEALKRLQELCATLPQGEPIVVATHLCYDAMTNKDALLKALGNANVVLIMGGHYHKSTVHIYKGHHFVQLPSPEPRSPSEVTVIRITSDRLVALPYDYKQKKWIREKKKILDVKIRGPRA